MVTDILISVSAAERYHEDILECLEQFSIPFEVNIWLWPEQCKFFSMLTGILTKMVKMT